MELVDYKIIKWNGMEHVVTRKIVCLEVIERRNGKENNI